MNWVDLLVLLSEESLETAIQSLSGEEIDLVIDNLCSNLEVDHLNAKRLILRILLERARVLAIPKRVWNRSPEDTWSVAEEIKEHHEGLGNMLTPDQIASLQKLYFQCKRTRSQIRVDEQLLRKNNYRCGLCGLPFRNEDLEHLTISSPHGYRESDPIDSFKPHYVMRRKETTYPTVDHIWPVSLYGDNGKINQNILCNGCNHGKTNYVTYAHSRPVVGHPSPKDLQDGFRVSFEVFYARISASPACSVTGKSWRETELTVRPINDDRALVFDNLKTVSYEALKVLA